MPTCPNGHTSAADDWCEVCGHRMGGTSGGGVPPLPPPPAHAPSVPGQGGYAYPGGDPSGQGGYGYPQQTPPPPAAQGEPCPQCGTPREPQAPFCEECRYNFVTQAPTSYSPPSHAEPQHQHQGSGQGYGYPQQHAQPSGDWLLPPPSSPSHAQPGPGADGPGHGYGFPQQGAPQSPAAPLRWTAVIGPDREYFMAMMGRSGPEASALHLPAYAPEQQLPLQGEQVTIGRRRQSTGEAPDIDLARAPEDPGVSHQHAVLVAQPDGGWAVVDQNSTNGTTINGGEDPIQPFVPHPLHAGDRVHVGAWTTITLHCD